LKGVESFNKNGKNNIFVIENGKSIWEPGFEKILSISMRILGYTWVSGYNQNWTKICLRLRG